MIWTGGPAYEPHGAVAAADGAAVDGAAVDGVAADGGGAVVAVDAVVAVGALVAVGPVVAVGAAPPQATTSTAAATTRRGLVGHAPGLVEREPSLDLRVGEHRVVDEVPVLVQRGADGELLRVDRGPGVGRTLRGKGPDGDRVHSQAVDQRRDLDACFWGKVRDQAAAVVGDVGDNSGRFAREDRVDDYSGILAAAFDLERLAGVEPALGVLVLLEIVGDPVEILADRDMEALDEVALGNEPRVVLGVMLGRFRGIQPEPTEQVRADEVVIRRATRRDERIQGRVEISPSVFDTGDPGEVVHARRLGDHLFGRDIQVAGQPMDGPVHGVAQPDGGQADGLVHGAHQYPHRVGVVQKQGVGANVLHVGDYAEHDGDRPEAPKHAAHVDRVVDRVAQPVLPGHVEVELRRARAAHLDRVDHIVGAPERLAPVEAAGDGRLRVQRVGGPARHPHRRRQAVGVDVVKHDVGVAQLRIREEVAEQVPGELDAPRADQDDSWHLSPPCRRRRPRRCARGPGCGIAPPSPGGPDRARVGGQARTRGARPARRRSAARSLQRRSRE